MRTSTIRAGDIVLCNKRGRLFHARVVELDAGAALVVEPIERNVSYRHIEASEIKGHWVRSTGTRRAARETCVIAPARAATAADGGTIAAAHADGGTPRLFE